jgi:hypothetical protein
MMTMMMTLFYKQAKFPVDNDGKVYKVIVKKHIFIGKSNRAAYKIKTITYLCLIEGYMI